MLLECLVGLGNGRRFKRFLSPIIVGQLKLWSNTSNPPQNGVNKKHGIQAVRHILTALPYGSVAVFYQTDVRLPNEGQVSKAFLVLKAAEEVPEAAGECVRG